MATLNAAPANVDDLLSRSLAAVVRRAGFDCVHATPCSRLDSSDAVEPDADLEAHGDVANIATASARDGASADAAVLQILRRLWRARLDVLVARCKSFTGLARRTRASADDVELALFMEGVPLDDALEEELVCYTPRRAGDAGRVDAAADAMQLDDASRTQPRGGTGDRDEGGVLEQLLGLDDRLELSAEKVYRGFENALDRRTQALLLGPELSGRAMGVPAYMERGMVLPALPPLYTHKKSAVTVQRNDEDRLAVRQQITSVSRNVHDSLARLAEVESASVAEIKAERRRKRKLGELQADAAKDAVMADVKAEIDAEDDRPLAKQADIKTELPDDEAEAEEAEAEPDEEANEMDNDNDNDNDDEDDDKAEEQEDDEEDTRAEALAAEAAQMAERRAQHAKEAKKARRRRAKAFDRVWRELGFEDDPAVAATAHTAPRSVAVS